MKTKIVLPSVHMNGSGRKQLFEQHHNAYMAVQAAIVALRESFPHDRDYYIKGPDVGPQARREAEARIEALEKVLGEVAQIWHSLMPDQL